MKTKSLFLKTSILFLIVLFHSALTKPVVAVFDDPGNTLDLAGRPWQDNVKHFGFDGKLSEFILHSIKNDDRSENDPRLFSSGVVEESLRVGHVGLPAWAKIDLEGEIKLDRGNDFSIEFWVRTTAGANDRFVVLSKKQILDNSLETHKQKGWAFCVCNGTWAWNIGSGDRRLTYERDNGRYMPVNDGRWHQLVMTFDHSSSLIRLYYDGVNWTTYHIGDEEGFDFSNEYPVTIGWAGTVETSDPILPAIQEGASNLQNLVDRFNGLGLGNLKPSELMDLVIESGRLIQARTKENPGRIANVPKQELNAIKRLTAKLSANNYTVHQTADFMQVAPLLKLYQLVDGRIQINRKAANAFAEQERFCRPEFDIDELSFVQRTLDSDEVRKRYSTHFQVVPPGQKKNLQLLTAASFNIHHGGKHETIEEDGWDSREIIAEILRRENVDVVMMQETYSSGDFIAAELGYYFATTVDWDYLNQGANISVLSRYPIREVAVPPNSSFMNVSARVAISQTQEIYVMSNWYGMNNFEDVFQFHKPRFAQSENIPILFAGDFNAVPHTDGGQSPASRVLIGSGFRDAYREKYPDVEKNPGPSHDSGRRIDQLYYKGSGLKNDSTRVLSKWPSRFPSDHFLIKSVFELDYKTTKDDS